MATIEATEPRVDFAEPLSPSTERARGLRMSTVFTMAFAVAGAAIGIRRLHDNSFMWHVRTGRLILDHGIPHHDPYSFSAPGAKWIAQSWLAELLYGVINRSAGGAFGLRLFGAILGAVISVALFRIALRLSHDRVRAFLLSLLTFFVLLQVWSERPLMLGLLAMVGVVCAVELPDSRLGRRPLVALPVIMWLWANVHGSFALGFLYLALHLVGRALEGAPPRQGRERALLEGTLLAGAVTLLNPYGLDLVVFPLRLMGRSSVLNGVEEWQSPNFREIGGRIFAVWIVVAIVILARKHVGKRDLLVSIAFLLLGLWAVRNVGLTAIVGLPILARAVRRDEQQPDPRRRTNSLIAMLLAVTALGAVVRAATEVDWNLAKYPVKPYALVESRFPSSRLLTTDAWGGYVIAETETGQQVFYDDRYDMYPLAVNAAYDDLATLRPNWLTQLDKWRIDVVMWPRDSPIVQGLAERSDWSRVYRDEQAAVYVRRSYLEGAARAG
jgi:hypothetical protein